MMSSTDLLTAAAALVSTEAAWCQKANARDTNGVWCPPDNENAVAWDIYGALLKSKIEGSFSVSDFQGAYEHVRSKIPADFHQGNQDIEYYNDTIAFSDVAAIFS